MSPLKWIGAALLLAGSHAAWGQAPVITTITNYQGQSRFCPGGVAQIFGTWPADGARNFSATVGGVQGIVTVSWIDAGVPTELDIQIPVEVPLGNAGIVISHLGANSNTFPVTISAFDPLLSFDPYVVFEHLSGRPVTPAAPAAAGEVAATFMNGLGVTNPTTATEASIAGFVPTAVMPTVTVGGMPAQLQFAGLYPGGKTGGYQVTFTVPAGTPSGPEPVVVTIGGVSSNAQTLFVGAQALPDPPTISGVANGANFSTKAEIAPGSFISIFATGLGNMDNLSAFPATTVNGISVLINGELAPIFHLIASHGQINALIPPDADRGSSLEVVVQNQNGPSHPWVVTGGAAGPGIFVVADPSNSARRNAAATFANTAWLVIPASQATALHLTDCAGVSAVALCGQPAHRGDFVQLYTTGLGKATPNGDPNGAILPTGQGAPAGGSPLYETVAAPTLTVGGVPATVAFSGLAPGFAGLYQVDFQIPPSAPLGDNVAVQISMPGSTADSATIAIAQ